MPLAGAVHSINTPRGGPARGTTVRWGKAVEIVSDFSSARRATVPTSGASPQSVADIKFRVLSLSRHGSGQVRSLASEHRLAQMLGLYSK